jgi:hypothetical protein
VKKGLAYKANTNQYTLANWVTKAN